jgi:Cu/Ag efflux protein CusF
MKAAKIALSLATLSLLGTAAFAQQSLTGMVTQIDRLKGTITIQQMQSGTVGASGGVVQEFKVNNGGMLEPIHAGDKVNFSTSGNADRPTIDKIQKQ